MKSIRTLTKKLSLAKKSGESYIMTLARLLKSILHLIKQTAWEAHKQFKEYKCFTNMSALSRTNKLTTLFSRTLW